MSLYQKGDNMTKTFPLRVDDETHKRLKILAAQKDTFVNTIIIEAIKLVLDKHESEHNKYSVENN